MSGYFRIRISDSMRALIFIKNNHEYLLVNFEVHSSLTKILEAVFVLATILFEKIENLHLCHCPIDFLTTKTLPSHIEIHLQCNKVKGIIVISSVHVLKDIFCNLAFSSVPNVITSCLITELLSYDASLEKYCKSKSITASPDVSHLFNASYT